ncbi:MAG: hypothetical protein JEY96_15070 [Bacteroidales bacterium]|nr:hypothetical protein [Bacteroidales bacterium]
MHKRILPLLFGVVFLFLVSIIIVKINNDTSIKEDVFLPRVSLKGINTSNVILEKELDYNKPIVLSFISVECNHCKFQAQDIFEHSNLYKNVNHIVVVEQHDSLETFLAKTKLKMGEGYKLTSVGYEIVDKFNIKGFPSTLVFDSNGIFLREFVGEMKVEKLNLKIRMCLNQKL